MRSLLAMNSQRNTGRNGNDERKREGSGSFHREIEWKADRFMSYQFDIVGRLVLRPDGRRPHRQQDTQLPINFPIFIS